MIKGGDDDEGDKRGTSSAAQMETRLFYGQDAFLGGGGLGVGGGVHLSLGLT